MRLILAVCISFLPFVAGCIAMAGETIAPAGPTVKLSWDTLITIYGPMAGMLGWFMYVEKNRMKGEKERNDTLISLVGDCTETITAVNATLVQLRAENEKQRGAIYRLVDEVHDFKGGLGDTKTYIMKRED